MEAELILNNEFTISKDTVESSTINPVLSYAQFNILLVDDREENLISLEEMLQAPNRSFIKASSGNEALKIALLNNNIGLILLDVQMPSMDGFEVAKLLQRSSKTRDIAIIFVTASDKEEPFVLRGFEEGAVDYLTKPLNINVTRAKVKVFEKLYFSQQELKRALTAQKATNKQLDRFARVVAHDLKTPLAGMISLVSLLQMDERIQTIDDIKQEMELLSQVSADLSDMITSLLYSSSQSTDEVNDGVQVSQLIKQISSTLFLPKHISIKIEEPLPFFKTNKSNLYQIFQNLIGNAIKYNDKPCGKIEIKCKDIGEFFEFSVKDNGPGILKEDLKRIFHLYETTNNKSLLDSSTGIGLYTVRSLVEEQGGKIWVESDSENGSTFFFQWRK